MAHYYGTLLWDFTYDGPDQGNDIPVDMAIDGLGAAHIVGTSFDVQTNMDQLVLKVDVFGNLLWAERNDYIKNNDVAAAIKLNPFNGNVITVGATEQDLLDWDLMALRYNSSGTLLNTFLLPTPNLSFDRPGAIGLTSGGEIYITGSTQTVNESSDLFLLKLSSGFQSLWYKTFDDNGANENAGSLTVNSQGKVIIGGSIEKDLEKSKLVILQYDQSGAIDCKYERESAMIDGVAAVRDLKIDNQDQLYALGTLERSNGLSTTIAQIDPNGQGKWIRNYTGATNSITKPTSLAVKDDGSLLYITGLESSQVGTSDYFIGKYEVCERSLDVVYDTTGSPQYIDNEIIIQFDPAVIAPSILYDTEQDFGAPCDVLAGQSQLTDALATALGRQNICDCKLFKATPGIDPTKRCIATPMGHDIPVPDFYSTFILKDCVLETVASKNTTIDLYEMSQLIDSLAGDWIRYAHPNFVGEFGGFCAMNDPNDPFAQYQHSLDSDVYPDADIDLCDAWNIIESKPDDPNAPEPEPVKVGIFDSGVNDHIDFIYNGESVLKGAWDFFGTTGQISNNGDTGNHGTPVAGIIGAVINNNEGIAGIAGKDELDTMKPGTYLYSYQIGRGIEATVNAYTNAINAILGLVDGLEVERPDIINYSVGFNNLNINELSLLEESTQLAFNSGLIITGITSNFDEDTPRAPGSFNDDWMMLTGSSGDDGEIKTELNAGAPTYNANDDINCIVDPVLGVFDGYSSNTGSPIDFIAPGAAKLTVTTADFSFDDPSQSFDYGCFSGTSAAAPHVVGISALMLGCNPDLSLEDLEMILQYTAFNLETDGYDEITGWGRVNARAALELMADYTILQYEFTPDRFETICDVDQSVNAQCDIVFEGQYRDIEADIVNEGRIRKHIKEVSLSFASGTSGSFIEYYNGENNKPAYWIRNSACTTWGEPTEIAADQYGVLPSSKAYFENNQVSISPDGRSLTTRLTGYTYDICLDFDANDNCIEWRKFPGEDCADPIMAFTILTTGNKEDIIVSLREVIETKNDIFVYPNPVKEMLNIEVFGFTNFTVQIYDVQGRLLMRKVSYSQIDTSFLKPGTYFIKINNKEHNFFKTFKFCKI